MCEFFSSIHDRCNKSDLLSNSSDISLMLMEEVIKSLPKIEQHVHIIGSTRPETLLWIFEDSGVESDLKTIKDFRNFFRYSDFDHFISVYSAVNDSIIDEKYYETITYEMLQGDSACNVKHVEAIFSAYDHIRRQLDFGKMVDHINAGIRKASRDFGITCSLRIDLVRNYGPEIGMNTLDLVEEKGANIVAIDIGGSEANFPPEPYKEVYKRAREMGLNLCAHAGEAAGIESIWGAVKVLNVDRIGHGTNAIQDFQLLKVIAKNGIGIETCPVSNLRTKAISDIREHPIRTFIDNNIKVSVNTDDPAMFNTDMNNEYITLYKELGFTVEELFHISLDALETSFLKPERKEKLRHDFIKEYQKILSNLPKTGTE